MAPPKVFLFWDNSNIFISAKNCAVTREKGVFPDNVRINFTNLYKLALASRPVGKAVAVGSIPPEQREIWDRMQHDTGITIELQERGRISGTEQGLDQVLQTHMLRACTDYIEEPQIAVLLTGDGRGFDDGIGFHADLERMYKRGWGVEVIAWDISCRRALREWARGVGSYIHLEEYYEAVTFIEKGRRSLPLNLVSRPMSKVGESLISNIRREEETTRASLLEELERFRKEEASKKRYDLKRKQRESKIPKRSRKQKRGW